MADNKSDYYRKLETIASHLALIYGAKLAVIDGFDPYLLHEEFPNFDDIPKVIKWDVLDYMVIAHASYTNRQFYRSLQSYIDFESGVIDFVNLTKIKEDLFVIVGKYKYEMDEDEEEDFWFICKKGGTIVTAHCTCIMDGSEICPHIGISLLEFSIFVKQVNRINRILFRRRRA